MKVGYARVSSTGQSLDVQLDKLKAIGCEKVFQEKQSGTTSERVQLKQCMDFVREGDTLVITMLDRFARSTQDLCNLVAELDKKGVDFYVVDQAIDTSTPVGRLTFHVLAAVAQFETEIRAERQADGIKKARENGVPFGRKKSLLDADIEQINQLRKSGTSIPDIAKRFRTSASTVWRAIRSQYVIDAEYEPRLGSGE